MRTILGLALAANIFLSAGANYLQSAIASQAPVVVSAAAQNQQVVEF
jgi:hypothetical protein